MKDAVGVTNKDMVAVNAGPAFDRTGFIGPFFLPGCKIKRVQIPIHGSDKDGVIHNRGRAFDCVFGFEFPADDELVGQRRASHPGLQGISAEDGPVRAGFFGWAGFPLAFAGDVRRG